MSTVGEYWKFATLATASYVRSGSDVNPEASEVVSGTRLAQLALEQDRLPASLARALFDPQSAVPGQTQWQTVSYYGADIPSVVDPVAAADKSGFAATLFEKNGEKVLAIRGTEPEGGFGIDLWSADLGQIGLLGLALTQLVSLANYVMRLRAPVSDENVPQIKVEATLTEPTTPGTYVVAKGSIPALIPGGPATPVNVYLSFTLTSPAKGLEKINPGEAVQLTGHSLGGHVAVMAATLFPDLFSSNVVVFNGAGYDPDTATPLLDALTPVPLVIKGVMALELGPATLALDTYSNQLSGGALNAINQVLGRSSIVLGSPSVEQVRSEDLLPGDDTSIVASALTGADKYGPAMDLPTENNNHVIEPFMDALALQAVLEPMHGPEFGTDELATVLGASANVNARSFEEFTEALHRLFVLDSSGLRQAFELPLTSNEFSSAAIGKGTIAARDAYHAAVLRLGAAVQDRPGLQLLSLAGSSEQDLEAATQSSVAHRYALQALNPFVVVGDDTIYTPHNQPALELDSDRPLDFYDASTGRGALTARWIDDRASFLWWKMGVATADTVVGTSVTPENLWFKDVGLRESTYVLSSSVPRTPQTIGTPAVIEALLTNKVDARRLFFGSDALEDAFIGGRLADSFFSGGGDDRLSAGEGDDYLEAGTGDDRVGGGSGNDILVGGKGADQLDGGLGRDTYVWRRGDGFDTITDARETSGAKLGSIEFLGDDLAGLKEQHSADNPYLFTDSRGILYALTGSSGVDGTLTIVNPEEAGGLVILGFRSGDFGIELGPVQSVAMTDLPGTAGSDNSFSTQPGHAESLRSEVENQRVYGFAGNDRIVVSHQGAEGWGGIGRDYLTNDGGDQKLYGEEDDDVLIASAGNDLLDGGSGNDALQGGADDDVLIGGDGNDFIDGGLGSDAINAGDGHDFIVGGGTMVVVMDEGALDLPTPPQFGVLLVGDAVGFGGMTGLLLASGDGANVIDAGAGDDVVIGGDATDYVEGGLGDDLLLGFAGLDSIFGDDGNDYILGDVSEGAYTLNGQVLFALPSAHGSDYLDGGAGEDTLSGDGGADELVGGAGNDLLLGDDGRLAAQWHGADYLDGGEGDDQLIGHGADDVLFGGAGNDQLDGDSSDTPYDYHGADYLDGEDGNDILKGSGGGDTLFGGEGDDQLFGDTDDTPLAYQGDDFLDGGAGDDYLRGYAGHDILYGGDGADEMLGEAGDDFLDGEAGDDLISGGDGADQLIGGAGDDDLQADAGDDTLDGGEGADLLFGGAGDDVAHGGAGNDQLVGNEGDDTLRGDEGDDIVFGEAGADDIDGGAGADTLLGGGGSDTLSGGEGDDVLAGEDATLGEIGGDDRLEGGGGNDTLLDEEVMRLCAKDGGVRVYETVHLVPEMFNQWGNVKFYRPTQGEGALGKEYLYKFEVDLLKKGNPSLSRYHIRSVSSVRRQTPRGVHLLWTRWW